MNITQKHFNFGLTLLSGILIYFLINDGTVNFNSILGMIGSTTFNLSLFLCSAFGLEYFLRGIDINIQEEIFDEKNIAASLYMLGLFLSIAIIISKAF